MLSKVHIVKGLSLGRAMSSKTPPVSSAAAAAAYGGLRLENQDDFRHMHGINTVRETPNLIEPKYKQYSYSMAKNYDTHLLCDTVGERLNVLAREKPRDVGYKFALTQTSLSFAEIKQRVDELAQNFLQLGFKKGDRIALILPNVPELVISLLAASSIGLITVLMNPAYQLTEIEFMLKKTSAKGIVILDNLKTLQHYAILNRICPELESSSKGELKSANLPELKHVIVVKNHLVSEKTNYKGTWSFEDELTRFNGRAQETPFVNFDDPFVMLFTSGTTGTPKGAVLSHFNLINGAYLDLFMSNLIEESRVIACPIPMFHVFGLAAGVLEPLVIGAKTVFPSFFPDTLALIKAIHAERCTAIKGAPIIYNDLLNHPERHKYDLSSLKYALIGASFVPRTLIDSLRNTLGIKYILPGYGLTESAAAATLCRTNYEGKHATDSVGEPMPFTEVKIVDSENKLLPVNTDGEICLRGYNVMKGYWEEPKKTAETIDQHGWLHTGDLGCMDENGILYFKGRAKELIIRGGVNIYPAEIESFFRTHPQVADVACFGYPDPRSDEEVCVWIKLRPNANLTTNDLINFCQGKIAYYKIPKYIKFVDALPINANGKVLKFKMLEQMRAEIEKSEKQ